MDQLKNKFGTAPVFFTAISTILGAILFLRFGFAVGQVGFIGTMLIILIGHAVTIPTAMAIAEIATNQKVEGGGEYYIISRSFGLVTGTAIGIALYLSQAISVAFYVMAFSEAFDPLIQWFMARFDLPPSVYWLLEQRQTIGIPALLLLTVIMLTKGANLGVKALYIVVFTLVLSLIAFFAGTTEYDKTHTFDPMQSVHTLDEQLIDQEAQIKQFTIESDREPIEPISFFVVFAIIFPAFTGMTAGVGLSGDLKKPGVSIPLGTLSATLIGMVVYVFIAMKLVNSADPVTLADTSNMVMSSIAWQGSWIIPLGLAAATISSALGSIMVAPRTLQALGRDGLIPIPSFNRWIAKGRQPTDEPIQASIVTIIIAGFFIALGKLDTVAAIISMFFMATYGSLCLISFLQHFSADPSYRPRFRSRWYISLFGALASFALMFLMNAAAAIIAFIVMTLLYLVIANYNHGRQNLTVIFQGVIFQISRQLQVFLQKANKEQKVTWRPSAICLTPHSFDRFSAFDLTRWLSQKYGFGTYIHLMLGYLSKQTYEDASACKDRLIKMSEQAKSNVYIDTLITPSYTTAIAQVVQLPGISGTDNNVLLFEFEKANAEELKAVMDNFNLIKAVHFDVVILGSSPKTFGFHKDIHIWLTANDFENGNLMILIAYIISGHKDWRGSNIKIFALFPEDIMEDEINRIYGLIDTGQWPVTKTNINFISRPTDVNKRDIMHKYSIDADLLLIGFSGAALKNHGLDVFKGYEALGNVLFVQASEQRQIK